MVGPPPRWFQETIVSMSSALAASTALVLLVGCAGEPTDEVSPSPTDTATSPAPSPTTPGPTPAPSDEPSPAPSPSEIVLEQPAVWPAPGVIFDDPEAVAADFVTTVFGFAPNLGEFQAGDVRSGEIEVRSPDETGGTAVRSVLLLRQLGPDDGWHVLAAISGTNSIDAPASGTEVPAGPLTATGSGRGFEGLLVVEAFLAGTDTRLDQQLAQVGSMEETEPYTATLDVSDAPSGSTIIILARGGVGLETDTGEFTAIPVLID